MRAAWSAVGDRLLHDDVFSAVLGPALADLDYEHGGWIAHCGVFRALCGALALELAWHRHNARYCRTAIAIVVIVSMQAAYSAGLAGLAAGMGHPDPRGFGSVAVAALYVPRVMASVTTLLIVAATIVAVVVHRHNGRYSAL